MNKHFFTKKHTTTYLFISIYYCLKSFLIIAICRLSKNSDISIYKIYKKHQMFAAQKYIEGYRKTNPLYSLHFVMHIENPLLYIYFIKMRGVL